MLGREIISDSASAFELGSHEWFLKEWSVSNRSALALRAKFMPNRLAVHSVVGWMKQKNTHFCLTWLSWFKGPPEETLWWFCFVRLDWKRCPLLAIAYHMQVSTNPWAISHSVHVEHNSYLSLTCFRCWGWSWFLCEYLLWHLIIVKSSFVVQKIFCLQCVHFSKCRWFMLIVQVYKDG